jgi:exopolysaccharide production protein ExoZ
MRRQIIMVQYIRAVSAAAIVLFHAGAQYHTHLPIGRGRTALFFLLSGFVCWLITAGRAARPNDFIFRRCVRLVPLYSLVTLILFLRSAAGWSAHGAPSAEALVTSLLFIPHLNAAGGLYPVLIPGWTLNYEMFFSLTFAGLLFLDDRRRLWASTLLFGGLATLGLVFQPTDPILVTYTNPILLEFLAGIWLAHLWPRLRPSPRWGLGLLGAGLAASFISPQTGPAAMLFFTAAIPALMILVGALAVERPGAKPIAWLKRVGDSSYSIYLWHIPALSISAAACALLHVASPAVGIACGTLAGIVAGLVLHEVLEKPLTAYLLDRLGRLRAVPARLAHS